ncbi:MAG TPA: hypothetical protein VGB53_01045, partial [Rubricoccaceae bacterium]
MTRAAAAFLLLVVAAGCEGRAAPVQIVVPGGTVTAAVSSFGPAEPLPACPPGEARVEAECWPALSAYAAPGGRTFVVDRRSGDDRADGSAARPWRTLARAAALGALRPGDAVLIRGGVYRETLAPRVGGTGPEARVT